MRNAPVPAHGAAPSGMAVIERFVFGCLVGGCARWLLTLDFRALQLLTAIRDIQDSGLCGPSAWLRTAARSAASLQVMLKDRR